MKSVACAMLAFALASCAPGIAEPRASLPQDARPHSATPSLATAVWVVYFARDLASPAPVMLEGPVPGAGIEQRLRQRMELLAGGARSRDGGAFNVLASMKARLASVAVAGDLVTLDYLVPEDDWGLNGSATLRAFVQQMIYTASEEPGIVRVLITQNGGRQAIVGGEGLVISAPQSRAGLGYEGLTPNQAERVIRMSVNGAHPLMIPSTIPSDWTAAVRADANAFSVTYRDPSGMRTVTLAVALVDLPLPGGNATQAAPGFHNDTASLYQVARSADPRSDRWLKWTEAGRWSLPGSGGVPYILSASGLTDMEFWRLANSLRPNQS